MKYSLYCFRDLKVGFMNPFCDHNDSSAIRGFEYALSQQSVIGFAPSDFELFCVGSFDSATGVVTSEVPRFIINGTDAYYNSLKGSKDEE